MNSPAQDSYDIIVENYFANELATLYLRRWKGPLFTMENKQEFKSKLLLLTSMTIFGTIGVFRRFIPFPSGMISLIRALIGTIFLLGFICIKGRKPDFPAIRKNLPLLLAAGVLLGFNWILLFEAYQYTAVSTATLCYYMEPVLFILAAPLVLKEKLTLKNVLCVLAALVGMGLVSGFTKSGINGTSDSKGIFLALAAAVLYTTVVLISKKLKNIDGVNVSLVQLATSSVVLIPYVLVVEDMSTVTFDPLKITMLLVIGIVHTGVAYALYYSSLKNLQSQTVALYSYIDPVVSVFLSILILGEDMNLIKLAGAVLILGAAAVNELTPSNQCQS